MENIILIGGGGHARACIDVIEVGGFFKVAGIVDVAEKVGASVLGYPIVGTANELSELVDRWRNAFICVGQIESAAVRVALYHRLVELGARLPSICSPLAHVSTHAVVGEGTIVMHGAIVNAGARIGRNCIVNSGALIEHDADVGDHVHISTQAVVNGGAQIGSGSFVGSHGTVAQGVALPCGSVLGAGGVLVRSPSEAAVFVGIPARPIRCS